MGYTKYVVAGRARAKAMCEAVGMDHSRVVDIQWCSDRPTQWGFVVLDDGQAGEIHHSTHVVWKGIPPEWDEYERSKQFAREDLQDLKDRVQRKLRAELHGGDVPDDSEINSEIATSESLQEALFLIAEKYDAAVTNNEPRWQNGTYLREVGDFIGDVIDAVRRHPPHN